MKKFFPDLLLSILLFCLVLTAAGAAPEDWETAANKRIEKIRKRDVTLQVRNAANEPVPGHQVEVTQLRRHFGFGTAIAANLLTDATYAEFFKDHFEWAVFENESKWYRNELEQGKMTFDEADYMWDFCDAYGIPVRGHCIFWEVEGYIQEWIKNLSDKDLKAAIDKRLEDAVTRYKEKFVHWDVNNEMLHGFYFSQRLGASIRPYMFQKARELDPDAKLFVNDYDIIAGDRTDDYIDQIQKLLAAGAPIDDIGVQGHFSGSVDPYSLYEKLDRLAKLNLPIWITEYDCTNSNPAKRAIALESLYRTAFSHPAVEGIMMWGFWEGKHWRGKDGAIVNLDWTLNEAGKRYLALMEEWKTKLTGTTDENGELSFRGFHGLYEITVTGTDGRKVSRRFDLQPDDDRETFLLNIGDWTQVTPLPTRTPKPWPSPTIPEKTLTPPGTILLTEDFNIMTVDAKPTDWLLSTPSGTVTVVEREGKDLCLQLRNMSGLGPKAFRLFPVQWGNLVVETQIQIPGRLPECRFNLNCGDKSLIRINTQDNGLFGYNSVDGKFVSLAKYQIKQWHDFKIVIDIPGAKCDIYVDGAKKASSVPFRTKGEYIDRIEIRISGGLMFVDNIKVYVE